MSVDHIRTPSKVELSKRCPATLHFPGEPYHNLRSKLRPHNDSDLHLVDTTVPAERPTSASGKPAMAIVRITWATEQVTP